MDEIARTTCPHCGETIEMKLDVSAGSHQTFVEDCWVCCRPVEFHVTLGADGSAEVQALRA